MKQVLSVLFVQNEVCNKLFQKNFPRKTLLLNQETSSYYYSKYYREHPYSSISLQSIIYHNCKWIIEIGDFVQLHDIQYFGQVLSIFILDTNHTDTTNICIDLILFKRATDILSIRHSKEIVCTLDILENVSIKEIKHFLKVNSYKHL